VDGPERTQRPAVLEQETVLKWCLQTWAVTLVFLIVQQTADSPWTWTWVSVSLVSILQPSDLKCYTLIFFFFIDAKSHYIALCYGPWTCSVAQAGLKLQILLPQSSECWEYSCEASYCEKNDLFYQSTCHPLRLLKIPQVTIFGDSRCLKGSCFFFQILVHPQCSWKLPTKLHALTHLPSLLTNRARLWTFDQDKSQVRGRCNCVRNMRRSHC
jgi:hypothetical protein